MKTEIKLSEFFNSSTISARPSINFIESKIKEMIFEDEKRRVFLDFQEIVQITRSVADELLIMKKKCKYYGTTVEFVNLNDFNKKMIDMVSARSQSSAPISYINVAATSIVDLKSI